jgi:hypothetical protein
MPPKIGLIGTLGAIALGLSLSGQASPAAAQALPDENFCRLIDELATPESFLATPEAVLALEDERHACHAIALAKWNAFAAPTASGAPGYNFQ